MLLSGEMTLTALFCVVVVLSRLILDYNKQIVKIKKFLQACN